MAARSHNSKKSKANSFLHFPFHWVGPALFWDRVISSLGLGLKPRYVSIDYVTGGLGVSVGFKLEITRAFCSEAGALFCSSKDAFIKFFLDATAYKVGVAAVFSVCR